MATTVRARGKGEITIPDDIRHAIGIEENSLLSMTVHDGEIRIRPLAAPEQEPGSPWLRELYAAFGQEREQVLKNGYTEAEINVAIDEALCEVRAEQRDPW